jgi:hypothetical protein
MLTTAGPYLCTIALKSGSTPFGMPVAGAVTVGAGCVTAGAVAPGPAPNAYRAPTGAPTAAAPIKAAKIWFLTKFLGLMEVSVESKSAR